MINRVMRLNNNPDARGFIVCVLEEVERDDALGYVKFKTIASGTAGTRKAANKLYDALRAEYITNVPGVRQPA